MAASAVHAIDVLGVEIVSSADGFGECGGVARDRDDVDVIDHQAISQHVQTEPLGLLFEPVEIYMAVIVNEENVLLIVATLSDMVRHVFKNYSGQSWHNRKYSKKRHDVNKKIGDCP